MDPLTELLEKKHIININANSPCAINKKCNNGNCEICSDNVMIQKMRDFSNINQISGNSNKIDYNKITNIDLLNKLKQYLKVDNEFEIITHPRFKRYVGINMVQNELSENFKPLGPINHNLFSNFSIDNVLKQLNKWDPTFYAHEYNMVDFMDYKGSLTYHPSFYFNNGYKTFGCVINSDKSDGRGIHWMAIFGDFRDDSLNTTNHGYTVEFFNSSGRGPIKELTPYGIWLNTFAKQVEEFTGKKCDPIIATNIMHQHSNTECGPYSVYYICARLLGISYKKFRESPIPDSVVFEFRKKILNDEKKV